MDSPSTLLSLWTFVAVMMAASGLLPCSAVDTETIETICSKTYNPRGDPTACKVELVGDPRTSKADLSQLSLVSLDLAQKQNALTFQTYDNFFRNGTWAMCRDFFELCRNSTLEVKDDLKEAQKLSTQKQFPSIKPVLAHSNATALLCVNRNPINSVILNNLDIAFLSSVETTIAVNNYIIAHQNIMI